jgi:hypothetical protein
MQAKCLRLMGKKLLVALALEGKFAGEGLQALDEDEDMLTAMARELVEKNRIGESADAVWKTLNGEHRRIFGAGAEVPVSEVEHIGKGGTGEPADASAHALALPPALVSGSSSGQWTAGNPLERLPVQGLLFE